MQKSMALLATLLVAMTIAGGSTYTLYAAPLAEHGGIHLSIADSTTGLPDAEGPPGGQVTMRVSATGTQNMAGLTFRIEFDPTVVTVPEDGVIPDEDLPDEALFVSNVNNTEGFVHIALVGFSQTGTIFPASMDIADIVFDLIGDPGDSTPLAFTNEDAFDGTIGDPQPIPVESADGTITIVEAECSISGIVKLDGRTNHSKGKVTATGPEVMEVALNADGSFLLTGLTPGTYRLLATAKGFLSAQKDNVPCVSGENTDLGEKELLGGDADSSGRVTITDIGILARWFGKTTVDCEDDRGRVVDIDCSGRTTITDIGKATANFGKASPQPW